MDEEELEESLHEYTPLTDPYYKLKHSPTLLDWLIGTELDRTVSYLTLVCINCGESIEIVCEDRRPYPRVTVLYEEE